MEAVACIRDCREEINTENKGKCVFGKPISDLDSALSGSDSFIGHFHFFGVHCDAECLKGLQDVRFTDIVVAVE